MQLRHRRRLTKWFCWTGSLFPGKSGDTSSQVHCQLGHLPQVTSCDLYLCPPTVTATLLVPDTHRPRSQVLHETPSPAQPSPPSSPGHDRAHTLSGSPASSQGAGSQASGQPAPSLGAPLCPLPHEAFRAPLPLGPQHTGQQPSCKGPPWLPSLKLGGVCDEGVSV